MTKITFEDFKLAADGFDPKESTRNLFDATTGLGQRVQVAVRGDAAFKVGFGMKPADIDGLVSRLKAKNFTERHRRKGWSVLELDSLDSLPTLIETVDEYVSSKPAKPSKKAVKREVEQAA